MFLKLAGVYSQYNTSFMLKSNVNNVFLSITTLVVVVIIIPALTGGGILV
ncbi:MAG: hypothetical protein ABI675_12400 [Chitinophagaceae bacterium]